MRLLDFKLGPWPLGIDNRHERSTLREGVRGATNVRFLVDGAAQALKEPLPTGEMASDSVFGPWSVRDGVLYQGTLNLGVVGEGPYEWGDGEFVVLHTGSRIFRVTPDFYELPRNRPTLSLLVGTGSVEGKTRIGVLSFKLGLTSTPQYTRHDKVEVYASPNASIYATLGDGSVFYRVGEADSEGYFYLADCERRAVLPNRDLEGVPVPVGYKIGVVLSRLVTAQRERVYYSEPFKPGVWNPYSVLPVPGCVRMLVGVGNILFIGTEVGTYVVRGLGQDTLAMTLGSPIPVSDSNPVRVPDNLVTTGGDPRMVAVWASEAGVQIGSEDGSIRTPAANRFKSTRPIKGRLAFNGKVFIFYGQG